MGGDTVRAHWLLPVRVSSWKKKKKKQTTAAIKPGEIIKITNVRNTGGRRKWRWSNEEEDDLLKGVYHATWCWYNGHSFRPGSGIANGKRTLNRASWAGNCVARRFYEGAYPAAYGTLSPSSRIYFPRQTTGVHFSNVIATRLSRLSISRPFVGRDIRI